MYRCLSALLAGPLILLTACATTPVPTAPPPAPDQVMDRMAAKVLSEENLDLVFGLMRRSLEAAAEGKPVPELSSEDKARLEATSKELKREALDASMKMLDQVEKEMREEIRKEGLGK